MLKKNEILKDFNMFISTGKFAAAIFLGCLLFLVLPAAMLAGVMTKEVLFDCTALAMVLTGAFLVLLGVINLIASTTGKVFGNLLCRVKDGSFKKIASGLLVCSVFGKQALAPLVVSSAVFFSLFAVNGVMHKETVILCMALAFTVTGSALILVGTVSILCKVAKNAVVKIAHADFQKA